MARYRKYTSAETHTFHIEGDVFFKVRRLVEDKLGKSLNEVINDYLRKLLLELEGSSADAQEQIHYDGLKMKYAKLVQEVNRLSKVLEKEGVFDDLKATAYELGLDFSDLHNADEVALKLLKTWEGTPEHLHLFISLMETAQQKKQLEKKLTEIRMRKYFSHEEGVNGETVSTAHSLQRTESLSKMRANGAQENP